MSKASSTSRYSIISDVSKLNESVLPYKIHHNESQLSLNNQSNEEESLQGGFKVKKKKKRRSKK